MVLLLFHSDCCCAVVDPCNCPNLLQIHLRQSRLVGQFWKLKSHWYTHAHSHGLLVSAYFGFDFHPFALLPLQCGRNCYHHHCFRYHTSYMYMCLCVCVYKYTSGYDLVNCFKLPVNTQYVIVTYTHPGYWFVAQLLYLHETREVKRTEKEKKQMKNNDI